MLTKTLFRKISKAVGPALMGLVMTLAAGLGQAQDSLRVSPRAVYGEPVEDLTFTIRYAGVDPESIGDGDIWVFGYDGYSSAAELVARETPAESDPGDPEVIVDPSTGEVMPWIGEAVVEAVYRIPHPDGDGAVWTADLNQRFALLLEPDQVLRPGGRPIRHQHLGFLNLLIGEERPPIVPDAVGLSVRRARGGAYFADVRVRFSDLSFYVSSWGDVTVDGSEVSASVEFSEGDFPGINELPPPNSYSYEIPELEEGEYVFVLKHQGEILAQAEFAVSATPWVEAVVELEGRTGPDGQGILEGAIIFLDPYFVMTDAGQVEVVELETDEFRNGLHINITAEEVTFIREPEVAPFPLEYPLPDLQDGRYQLSVFVNGSLKFQSVIRIPLPDPSLRPVISDFSADKDEIRLGESVTLSWLVEGADRLEIRPGIGPVEGNSISVRPGFIDTFRDPLEFLLMDVPGFEEMMSIIPRGAGWKYYDGVEAPDSSWMTNDFEDSSWESGASPLGYGDDDVRTRISFGDDPEAKTMTAYFRHEFEVEDRFFAPESMPLLLRVFRDDGVIVYLNGEEIIRSNMPSGPVGHTTAALENARGDGRRDPVIMDIDASMLQPGTNVIAMEVHQSRPDSSDLYMTASLGTFEGLPWPPADGPFDVTYTLIASNSDGTSTRDLNIVVVPDQQPEKHTARIDFFEGDSGYQAHVILELLPGYQVIEWGELDSARAADGSFQWMVQVMIEPISDLELPGPAPEPLENFYSLGDPEPGLRHSFTVMSGGKLLGRERLYISRDPWASEVSGVSAEAPTIRSANTQEALISVRYELSDGMDTGSLGDDDIFIVPAGLEPFIRGGNTAARVAAYPAELADFQLFDDQVTVEAQYLVKFTPDFFGNVKEMLFDIILMDGGVVSASGQGIAGGRIGVLEVRIRDTEPPTTLSAKAEATPVQGVMDSSEIHLVIESEQLLDPQSLSADDLRVVRSMATGDRQTLGPLRLVGVEPAEEPHNLVMARFLLAPPEGGWKPTHNGRWTLEMAGAGIHHIDGTTLPDMKVGNLMVLSAGEPPFSGDPEARLKPFANQDFIGVDARLVFPAGDMRMVADWGHPVNEHGTVYINATSVGRDTLEDGPYPQQHRYHILPAGGGESGTPVGFRNVEYPNIGVRTAETVVINSGIEWRNWAALQVGDAAISLPSPVDFEENTLIGVFAGEKPTGGFSINVQSVKDYAGRIRVVYDAVTPSINDVVTDALTYPQQLIAISKSDLPVDFYGNSILLPSNPVPTRTDAGYSGGIPVVFRLDGDTLAKTVISEEGFKPDPDDTVLPSSSEVSVVVKEAIATISVVADFTGAGVPVQFNNWDELEIRGNYIVANLLVDVLEDDGEIPTPGAPPVFEGVFTTGPLKPAHYQFLFTVNGHPVARNFFMVKGDHPFFDWLDEHLRSLESHADAGLNAIIHQNDADGDGLSDFYEWAMLTNPVKSFDRAPVRPGIITRNGKKHFTFDFDFREGFEGVDYQIQGSDDLLKWVPIETSCTVMEHTENGDGTSHVSLCLDQAVDQVPTRFIRVVVINTQEAP